MGSTDQTISVLLPHPPIIVPDVGRDRLKDCAQTVAACEQAARRVVAAQPDRLVLISPHSPRQGRRFGIWAGTSHQGDLAQFGAADEVVKLPADRPCSEALLSQGSGQELFWTIPAAPLDHGAVVPLWFLQEAGWSGPTTILSLPAVPVGPEIYWQLGELLAATTAELPGRVAWVASGDMSHRCLPGAPAGYHPRGVEFDRFLTSLVEQGQYRAIADIDPELRSAAAEDASETSLIVTAASSFETEGREVLSYEHPFGVGYLVAIFHDLSDKNPEG